MQDNITPEEKLLNLIKKDAKAVQDTQKQQPEKKEPEKKKPEVLSKPEVNPIRKGGALSNRVKAQSAIPRKTGQRGSRQFSIINKLLVIVFFCAIVYMVFIYLYAYKSKSQIQEKIKGGEGSNIAESVPKTSPPLSYYTDIMNRRQMFKIYEIPKPKPAGPPKPKITLQQLLGGYTFVGIIFGDTPQAIVEERRTGQSFYLIAGQFLGEIKIEKIESGKITVSYEGETMDIRI